MNKCRQVNETENFVFLLNYLMVVVAFTIIFVHSKNVQSHLVVIGSYSLHIIYQRFNDSFAKTTLEIEKYASTIFEISDLKWCNRPIGIN